MPPITELDLMSQVQKRRQAEVIDFCLWFKQTIANGNTFTSFRFFDDTSGKTPQQTNMRLPGSLPEPWSMDIQRILFHVSMASGATFIVPTLAADVQKLIKGMFSLTVGTKPMYEQLLWLLPAGHGVFGQISLESNGAGTMDLAQNGFPSKQAHKIFRNPIRINPKENFFAEIRYDTAPDPSVDTEVTVLFDGIVRRGIQ